MDTTEANHPRKPTSPVASARAGGAAAKPARDLRLDFFRGLALFFIFFNHVPANEVSWITNRAWGFSDATEIFVFVSGYAAVLAYGGVARRQSYLLASLRILKRVWQLYAAHLLLFLAYTAQIAWLAARVGNPMFAEEMAILDLVRDPQVTILQAMLLRFRPVNMDVLPLYIVLLGALPLFLWALQRHALELLGASFALWAVAWFGRINLAAWPAEYEWYFNPLSWQLLFVMGALCAARGDLVARLFAARRVLLPLSIAYVVFSLLIVLTWNFPTLERLLPNVLERALFPVDKVYLDLLRVMHFLACAYLVLCFLPAGSKLLRQFWAQPFIIAGKHSLYVFCVGIFLSFTAHFFLVEIDGSLLAQIGISLAGVAVMVALGYALELYRRLEKQPVPGGSS
jgi:hypothetical protein